MNFTPWSGSNLRTALRSPSFPMATSSERSSPCPWYFFTYEMTNRRFAVTSRSAAFSSPACARRASRLSSSASVMRGSFWMSWRYWSNAVEGDERKKPLDLLSVEVCIHAPVGLFAQAHFGSLHLYRAHNSDGVSFGQQPRFMPLRNVIRRRFYIVDG